MTLNKLFSPVVVCGFGYGLGSIVDFVHPYQFNFNQNFFFTKKKPTPSQCLVITQSHTCTHVHMSMYLYIVSWVTILHNINFWILVFVLDMSQEIHQTRWIYHYPHWSCLQIKQDIVYRLLTDHFHLFLWIKSHPL